MIFNVFCEFSFESCYIVLGALDWELSFGSCWVVLGVFACAGYNLYLKLSRERAFM